MIRKPRLLVAIAAVLALAAFAGTGSAAAATQQHAYVAAGASVQVISLSSNTVVKTLTVGTGMNTGVATDPERHTVYVANSDGSVYEINATTNTIARKFKLPAAAGGNYGLAVGRAGQQLFAGYNQVNGNSLAAINLTTGKIRYTDAGPGVFAIGVDPHSQNLFAVDRYTGDGYYGEVYAVNTITLKANPVLTTPYEYDPLGIAINSVTDQGYIVGDGGSLLTFDTAKDTWVSSSPYVGIDPWGIAVSADGTRVYAVNRDVVGYVDVINPANDAVVAQVPIAGGQECAGIAFAASIRSVIVADQDGNDVVVISEATNTVTHEIPVATGPTAIGVL